jgi:hypothetical protein
MGVKTEQDEVVENEQADEQTEVESQDEAAEEGEEGNADEGAEEGADEGGEEEDVVQIGSEEAPASEEAKAAPQWVKDLRQRQRELARENAELKAKLNAGTSQAKGKPELPQKPKLADYDYDEEAYDKARDEWDAKKRAVDAWEADQEKAAEEQAKRIRAIDESYAKSRQALKVSDFEDAEEAVVGQFTEWQQGIVKAGAANPGAMVYALGKTPKKLQELASIKDPVKFAVAIGKLETEVKVTRRTGIKPAPETPLRGNSNVTASKATLERLQAEADRTGDRTKVAAYLRQQKLAGK